MAEDLISNIVDRQAVKGDIDFLTKELQNVFGLLTTLKESGVELRGASSVKEVSTAAANGSKNIDLLGKSVERLKFAISEDNVELQKNNALVALANKEAKALGKEQAGLSTEYDKQAKRLTELKNQLKGLVAAGQDSGEAYEKLKTEFTQLDTVIRKADKSVGDFTRNVGNYEGSAKIIVDSLEKEKKKLEELEKTRIRVQNAGASPLGSGIAASGPAITARTGSGDRPAIGFNASKEAQSLDVINAAIEETQQKVEALSAITNNERFLNISARAGDSTAQIKFFTKALIDLERQGLGNTDAAKQLRGQLAELTDQVADAKAEVKALSSDTRGFDLFAGSVTFAADAFQTFAGAAVLAGASEEDAAEATKTLVAVQSVANGVKGIANELTTRGTAANKLFAFTQNQIALATNASASSFTRFKAALAATGVGLLVIGIGLLVANFDKLKRALGFASEAQDAYNETLQDYREAAKGAIENVAKVGVAFQQAKDGVISKDEALFEYNKTLGDTLGKAKTLEEAEDNYANKADTYIKIQGLKAQANALFAKSADAISKGITADLEDQTNFVDKTIAGLKLQFGFGVSAVEGIVEAQKSGAAEAKKSSKELGDALQAEAEKLLTQSQQLANGAGITTNTDFAKEQEKKQKEASDKAQKALEERLKNELDLRKRNLAAAKVIALEEQNENIRKNQVIVDNDNTSFKDRLAAIENIAQARKNISAIELSEAVRAEQEVKNGRIVEIKKTQAEIEAATVSFNNKVAGINAETLKAQQQAQKQNAETLKAEREKQTADQLKAIDQQAQSEQDKLNATFNEKNIELNNDYQSGKISQEQYLKEKERLELEFQRKSLDNEITHQENLLKVSTLPDDQKAEALRKLSDLRLELNKIDLDNTKKTEAEKKAAILKTFDEIRNTADKAFEFIGGILNANSENQKNRLREEQDEAEKKAARDIEITQASTLTEEEKANRVAVINARLAAQKEQFARREREINLQNARFEKARNIFTIAINTARSIVEASPNPFKIALAAAVGAVQLGIAIATPLPKYYKGKNVTDLDKYEGPATVNEYRDEVIKRTDGSVEFPKGRNVTTWLGANDIVYPSMDAYLNSLIAATHKDSMPFMNGAPVIINAPADNSEAKRTNILLQRLISKPSANISIYDNGHAQYEIESTNWK